MLDPSENPPQKRARRSTRGTETIDNSCEATRESNTICPITCGCRNSFLDIREKTRVVSHILRATRKILKNELIASFGLTAAITNKDEISELKLAQKERNSNLYRTSIQYTVLGSIHGKEVCLVPPRCDIHWNANLEVAAIEHYEDTDIVPMAILRARKDIEKDTEILTRYWHKEKDAWQNLFECQCCACTNHTGMTINTPVETADMTTIEDLVPTVDYTPRKMQDLSTPISCHESSQNRSARDKQDYPAAFPFRRP